MSTGNIFRAVGAQSWRSVVNLVGAPQDRRIKRMLHNQVFSGWKRIYHYHVRKTGGTSINHMFLLLADEHRSDLYEDLGNNLIHRVIAEPYVFVGWNAGLIEKGAYSFAFSHIPEHSINIPDNTYKFTCLRDPVERIVSHYKMVKNYVENNIPHPMIRRESEWLGENIIDFVQNMPDEHLFNQLYMFSSNINVEEALEKLASLDRVLMTESLALGVDALANDLLLTLQPQHVRRAKNKVSMTASELEILRETLDNEYNLLHKCKKEGILSV